MLFELALIYHRVLELGRWLYHLCALIGLLTVGYYGYTWFYLVTSVFTFVHGAVEFLGAGVHDFQLLVNFVIDILE